MMRIKSLVYSSASALIAAVLVYLIVMILSPKIVDVIVEQKSDASVTTMTQVLTPEDALAKDVEITNCLKNSQIQDKGVCYQEEIKKPSTPNLGSEMIKKPNAFDWTYAQFATASPFVQLMYFVAFIALFMHIKMYVVIRFDRQNDVLLKYHLDNKESISDFTTNAPIVGGVLATMFSFSEYASTSDSSLALMEAFKSSVYDGVSTTLVGGMVYMLCLYLNLSIQKEAPNEHEREG